MTLRNAFDNLGTESALRRIVNLLTFARDSADRIRVVVDSQPAVYVYNRSSGTSIQSGTGELWYSALSWNIVDAREPLVMQNKSRADFIKRNRWTF